MGKRTTIGMSAKGSPVAVFLRQRGFPVDEYRPREDCPLILHGGPDERERFYKRCAKYSFRMLLRDVIGHAAPVPTEKLTKYCDRRTADRYMEFLADLGVVEGSGSYRLTVKNLHSFGTTLEWYLANLVFREFAMPAIWGVRIAGLEPGGDYDVIALAGERLVVLEVKSSPPKHIDLPEIKQFVIRMTNLVPDVCILVCDTELRMKDKLVPLTEDALEEVLDDPYAEPPRLVRLKDETFHFGHRFFLTNAKPGLTINIGLCLRTYFTALRGGKWPENVRRGI